MAVASDSYSRGVATVFVFNLIFGSGALLLVLPFWSVGYVLGIALFVVLAFLSFTTCTFIVEAMAIACAIKKYESGLGEPTTDAEEDLKAPLLSGNDDKQNFDKTYYFEIDTKFELSELARNFFSKPLLFFFFISMIVYLYGDLLIYLSVVGSSLQKLTCKQIRNMSTPASRFCSSIGEVNIFRIYVSGFTLLVGTLIFFNVTKTKVVQFGTITLRWLAFILMIVLAIMKIIEHPNTNAPPVRLTGLPLFIGAGLYAFMCQHSLPSILYPIREKNKSYIPIVFVAVLCVLILYLFITITGIMAFHGSEIMPVYTMNFMNFDAGVIYIVIGYYLQLFPVAALTSSYPIVGITLRENIKALLFKNWQPTTPCKFFLLRVLLPALVVYPPFVVVLFVSDRVSMITGIVGSYAGTLVQYVIPALLIIYCRRKGEKVLGSDIMRYNFQRSPFGNIYIASIILLWSIFGIAIVTYYQVLRLTTHVE